MKIYVPWIAASWIIVFIIAAFAIGCGTDYYSNSQAVAPAALIATLFSCAFGIALVIFRWLLIAGSIYRNED